MPVLVALTLPTLNAHYLHFSKLFYLKPQYLILFQTNVSIFVFKSCHDLSMIIKWQSKKIIYTVFFWINLAFVKGREIFVFHRLLRLQFRCESQVVILE